MNVENIMHYMNNFITCICIYLEINLQVILASKSKYTHIRFIFL